MKLRQEGQKRKDLRAADLLRHEKEEKVGFDPDLDISPEVKTALFTELGELKKSEYWLEYIVLFNYLESLFPDMQGEQKENISVEDVKRCWTEAFMQESGRTSEVQLNSINPSSGSWVMPWVVAAELRAYGLNISEVFSPALQQEFATFLEDTKSGNIIYYIKHLLVAARLGMVELETEIEDRELAWEKFQRGLQSQTEVISRMEFLVAGKVLFPEHSPEISEELIQKAKNAALKDISVFGPLKSAGQFRNLQLVLAETVQLGERGTFLIQKSKKGGLNKRSDLPARPIL